MTTANPEIDEFTQIGWENQITTLFFAAILAFFALGVVLAIFVALLKPEWFRLNVYTDPGPQMTDCSCLNCLPCTSCGFRQFLDACWPRMNLKQNFNCITTCCTREGPDRINLVCCVV